MDAQVLDIFEHGGQKLRRAVAGMAREDLVSTPIPNTWSIQQIVIHLMDDELIWVDRVKRMIAEDNPRIMGFDESKYAANLHYDLWSIDDAITIFELNRVNFAHVLRAMPLQVMDRTGMHNERGQIRVGDIIPKMNVHLDHHLKFLHKKRELLGKPIKD
jgi:uncharacterized damage-inducible protein DinB